jgi:hypothetical protein
MMRWILAIFLLMIMSFDVDACRGRRAARRSGSNAVVQGGYMMQGDCNSSIQGYGYSYPVQGYGYQMQGYPVQGYQMQGNSYPAQGAPIPWNWNTPTRPPQAPVPMR